MRVASLYIFERKSEGETQRLAIYIFNVGHNEKSIELTKTLRSDEEVLQLATDYICYIFLRLYPLLLVHPMCA